MNRLIGAESRVGFGSPAGAFPGMAKKSKVFARLGDREFIVSHGLARPDVVTIVEAVD